MRDNYYTLPQISFVAGQTKTLGFNLWTEGGELFNADGCTGNFSVVEYSNKTGDILISKNMTFEVGEDPEMVSVAKVELTPSDTVGLYGKYVYQLTIKGTGNDVEIPNQGILLIVRNINESLLSNGGGAV